MSVNNTITSTTTYYNHECREGRHDVGRRRPRRASIGTLSGVPSRSFLEPFKFLIFAQGNSVNSALQPVSLVHILIGQLLGFRQLSVDLGAPLVELGVIPIFGNKL